MVIIIGAGALVGISEASNGRWNVTPALLVTVSGIWPHIVALSLSGLVMTVKNISLLSTVALSVNNEALRVVLGPWSHSATP